MEGFLIVKKKVTVVLDVIDALNSEHTILAATEYAWKPL